MDQGKKTIASVITVIALVSSVITIVTNVSLDYFLNLPSWVHETVAMAIFLLAIGGFIYWTLYRKEQQLLGLLRLMIAMHNDSLVLARQSMMPSMAVDQFQLVIEMDKRVERMQTLLNELEGGSKS